MSEYLKGDRNPSDKLFYKKDFDISFIKIDLKIKRFWSFEYLEMDYYGNSHIVGVKTSQSLIEYA